MSSPIPPWNSTEVRPPTRAELSGSKTLREMVEAYEMNLILLALKAAQGHQRRASRMLGLLPSTLNEKMRRYRIRNPEPSGSASFDGGYRASDAALMMSAKTPEAVTSGPAPGPLTTSGDVE